MPDMETVVRRNAEILYNRKLTERYFRLGVSLEVEDITPGQFFMLRVTEGLDPLLRRPLGAYRIIECAPGSTPGLFSGSGVEFLYEVVGRGTAMLSEKETGESVDILGPLGRGFHAGPGRAVMVAGGVGIVPFYLLSKALGGGLLLFGGRSARDTALVEDFRGLGCTIKVSTDDGSAGRKGFVTELLCEELTAGDSVYACGPKAMLARVAAVAEEAGAACQVSLERNMACGIGVCLGCAVRTAGGAYRMVCSEGPVFDASEVDWKALL